MWAPLVWSWGPYKLLGGWKLDVRSVGSSRFLSKKNRFADPWCPSPLRWGINIPELPQKRASTIAPRQVPINRVPKFAETVICYFPNRNSTDSSFFTGPLNQIQVMELSWTFKVQHGVICLWYKFSGPSPWHHEEIALGFRKLGLKTAPGNSYRKEPGISIPHH